MLVNVSVIVPVYNVEKYLRKCLNSCVYQTLKQIEVIIINDGSLDSSEDIAKEYVDKYDWMQLITTENRGLSEARNEGIRRATGKYIYFLDSDDWIDKECLQECFELAERENLEVVTFDAKTFVEKGMSKKYATRSDIRTDIIDDSLIYDGREFITRYEKNGGNKVQAWLKFLRRDFVIGNRLMFPKGLYYEDVTFHYECMRKVKRMRYLPKAFYNRLYRENSIVTSEASVKKIYSVYSVYAELLSGLKTCEGAEGIFWLEVYGNYIRGLMRSVIGGMTRKEIEGFWDKIGEIQSLQYRCIKLYWEQSRRFNSHLDNEIEVLNTIIMLLEPFGVISDDINRIVSEIIAETEYQKDEKVKNLPFSKKETIGVYGGGNHAKIVFERYIELVGEIKSNIVFIETECISYEKKFMGYDVINIKDVPTTDIKEIVLMSYLHEEKMYETAKQLLGDSYRILPIYDGDTYRYDAPDYRRKVLLEQIYSMPKEKKKRIVLMNIPEHTNIGDHIITLSEEIFLEHYFPDKEILSFSGTYYRENRRAVKRALTAWDTILITGGGFLGSMWADGVNTTNIIHDFKYNKIVVLPQSLFFEQDNISNEKELVFTGEVVRHPDIVFCFRERLSLERAKKMFDNQVNCQLMPDMALLLTGFKYGYERKGVLLCLRNDKEGTFSEQDKMEIECYCKKNFKEVSATSMHYQRRFYNEEKKEIIEEKLKEFARAELVITDTLHCMISCALTGTPCIAFNNITGKVHGVYEWIKELDYIKCLHDVSELLAINISEWSAQNGDQEYSFNGETYEQQFFELI